jgi:hypothetical protein
LSDFFVIFGVGIFHEVAPFLISRDSSSRRRFCPAPSPINTTNAYKKKAHKKRSEIKRKNKKKEKEKNYPPTNIPR